MAQEVCPICGGSGWKIVEREDVSGAERCECALESRSTKLDDLGAHRVNDWVEDTITSIITHRCNHKKPLIATTNLPDTGAGDAVFRRNPDGQTDYRKTLADLIGSRARSRLFEMCRVVKMP